MIAFLVFIARARVCVNLLLLCSCLSFHIALYNITFSMCLVETKITVTPLK